MLGLIGPIDLIILYKLPVAFTLNNVMVYASLKIAYGVYAWCYTSPVKNIWNKITSHQEPLDNSQLSD